MKESHNLNEKEEGSIYWRDFKIERNAVVDILNNVK